MVNSKSQGQRRLSGLQVTAKNNHPALCFGDFAQIVTSGTAMDSAALPTDWASQPSVEMCFGMSTGNADSIGSFALRIVGKQDAQPEVPTYAIVAFHVSADGNDTRHFMTLAETEHGLDLARHPGPYEDAYRWNLSHRLVDHQALMVHSGIALGQEFVVRARMSHTAHGALELELNVPSEEERSFFYEPLFLVAPVPEMSRRFVRRSSVADFEEPDLQISDPEDSLFVNIVINHPDIVLRHPEHYVVTGIVGDELKPVVERGTPGTGLFYSTLECRSRGNIIYEVVSRAQYEQKQYAPRLDRLYLVLSWQVNPTKRKPGDTGNDTRCDDRYRMSAMVLHANSPGFPLRGYTLQRYFDTVASFAMDKTVPTSVYSATDGERFRVRASITPRETHTAQYPDHQLQPGVISADKYYYDLEKQNEPKRVPLVRVDEDTPSTATAGNSGAAPASTTTEETNNDDAFNPFRPIAPGEEHYLEPAVMDVFIELPEILQAHETALQEYPRFAPASGFYWENYRALLRVNDRIGRMLTWKPEEVLLLVENAATCPVQLRTVYETIGSGARVNVRRAPNLHLLRPDRFDLFALQLAEGMRCRRVYLVEDAVEAGAETATPSTQHRQYIVNTCERDQSGVSVVYGWQSDAQAAVDGAAVVRFLDATQLDWLTPAGGDLFSTTVPLAGSYDKRLALRQYRNFGGPNVMTTVVDVARGGERLGNSRPQDAPLHVTLTVAHPAWAASEIVTTLLSIGGHLPMENAAVGDAPHFRFTLQPQPGRVGDGCGVCIRLARPIPSVLAAEDLYAVEVQLYRPAGDSALHTNARLVSLQTSQAEHYTLPSAQDATADDMNEVTTALARTVLRAPFSDTLQTGQQAAPAISMVEGRYDAQTDCCVALSLNSTSNTLAVAIAATAAEARALVQG